MIEEELGRLRWTAAADSIRPRILAAAERARRERRALRWMYRATLLVIGLSACTLLFGKLGGPLRGSVLVDPDHRPRFVKYLGP